MKKKRESFRLEVRKKETKKIIGENRKMLANKKGAKQKSEDD